MIRLRVKLVNECTRPCEFLTPLADFLPILAVTLSAQFKESRQCPFVLQLNLELGQIVFLCIAQVAEQNSIHDLRNLLLSPNRAIHLDVKHENFARHTLVEELQI